MIESTDRDEIEKTEDDDDGDDDGKTSAKDKISGKDEKAIAHEREKKISRKEKKWTCDDKPLWRVFMNSYLDEEEKLEREDKLDSREAPVLPRFPKVKSSEQIPPSAAYPCFPLNTFNLRERARLPDRLKPHEKIRLWRNMKNDTAVDTSSFLPELPLEILRTNSGKWPGVWPCVDRDLAGELKKLEKVRIRKIKGSLPCQLDIDSESNDDDDDDDVPRDDFADRKELGHARVPIACLGVKKNERVDRASGEHPGLVDGDYVVFVFDSGDNGERNRSYADVCLRGLKGMHLAELSCKRVREKTWKFCFYQAIVALLAKTQLRYKYAWSVNIDYIFDHAWMLFVHMGGINVKERIRLDDVVVYNYMYSVELDLVHEMKDAPRITTVGWNFVEENLGNMLELERPELTKIKEEIGWRKAKDPEPPPVHEITRKIEEWFDELPDIYRNCVLRTSRFSLAFWKDGSFWYLFNPYRCDEFGFWRDDGYACIIKFCTRNSLKRHLMILILRAYSYEPDSPLKLARKYDPNDKREEARDSSDPTISVDERTIEEQSSFSEDTGNDGRAEFFTIQIYQMIYHCVKIHNVKLLQRKPPDPRTVRVGKKEPDYCSYPPASYDPCAAEKFSMELENGYDEDSDDTIEKPVWLERLKLKWTRFAVPTKRSAAREESDRKLRWHRFYVEEPHKIFSLWGEIHPTEEIFAKANRGKQMYACYVVCAGMTRIQAPEYWSPKTLDAIVMCGDRYYTLSRLESQTAGRKDQLRDANSWNGYLGKHCKIGETLFEVEILPAACGRLYDRSGRCLWNAIEEFFLSHHFGILTCESHCLCVLRFCGSYYMMDANSIGPPLFQYGAGVAYLIRATSFVRFINVLVLTIGSSECSKFFVNPIEIGRVVDLGTTALREKRGKARFRKIEYPREDRTKGSKKFKAGGERTIDRVYCRRNGCGN